MVIEFGKEYLRELYVNGKTADKKHRFQPEIVKAYRKTVLQLMAVFRITDLFTMRGLNYEVLQGDKAGISPVRINQKYRLEFTVKEVAGEQIITICTLLEISNHYK